MTADSFVIEALRSVAQYWRERAERAEETVQRITAASQERE